MKLFREKNRQQAFLWLAACIVIFIIIIVFANFLIYKDYNKQVSLVIVEMISKIKEVYPDVKEETLIHILNQKSQKGEVNLSDFGIEKDTINVIQSMESCFYHSLFLFLVIFFSFGKDSFFMCSSVSIPSFLKLLVCIFSQPAIIGHIDITNPCSPVSSR